ncbi:MAG: universal stress protein, partial [Ornithinimicrobium sp.]
MADSDGPLVVGYDSSPDADWAVDWAAVEAVRRGRSLIVLFAADLPRLTGPDITMGHQGDHAQEMAGAVAQAGVKRARAAAPEVAVEARITRLGAAVALIEASVDASLLVVGGRGRLRLSE